MKNWIDYGPLGGGFAVIWSDRHGVLDVDTGYDSLAQAREAATKLPRIESLDADTTLVREFGPVKPLISGSEITDR